MECILKLFWKFQGNWCIFLVSICVSCTKNCWRIKTGSVVALLRPLNAQPFYSGERPTLQPQSPEPEGFSGMTFQPLNSADEQAGAGQFKWLRSSLFLAPNEMPPALKSKICIVDIRPKDKRVCTTAWFQQLESERSEPSSTQLLHFHEMKSTLMSPPALCSSFEKKVQPACLYISPHPVLLLADASQHLLFLCFSEDK